MWCKHRFSHGPEAGVGGSWEGGELRISVPLPGTWEFLCPFAKVCGWVVLWPPAITTCGVSCPILPLKMAKPTRLCCQLAPHPTKARPPGLAAVSHLLHCNFRTSLSPACLAHPPCLAAYKTRDTLRPTHKSHFLKAELPSSASQHLLLGVYHVVGTTCSGASRGY